MAVGACQWKRSAVSWAVALGRGQGSQTPAPPELSITLSSVEVEDS